MLAIDVALFGAIGLTVWAVQMAWIPFWAAGVVNGIGHYWGYRNYNSPDTSTNVFPWGIVIGGEELHNNHHAHGTSAKFSAKWYEFDIGWCYINILKFLGLAKIKKVAPKLKLDDSRTGIDLRTLQGVITHRYEVMARYADIIKSAAREELAKMKASRQEGNAECGWSKLHKVRRAIHRNEDILQPEQLQAVDQAIAQNKSLSTLVQMRRELGRIWESSSASSEQLLHDLQAWCQRAQQSGIAGLEQFAQRLRATRHDAREAQPRTTRRSNVRTAARPGPGRGGQRQDPVLTTRMAWLIQTGQASPLGCWLSRSPIRPPARCWRGCRPSCRSTRAVSGSAPSTGCAIACCGRITAMPACRKASRSSMSPTSSPPSSG